MGLCHYGPWPLGLRASALRSQELAVQHRRFHLSGISFAKGVIVMQVHKHCRCVSAFPVLHSFWTVIE
jgi:hypothetical protein